MKPYKRIYDHEEYFTCQFKCSACNSHLCSYDYGRVWCDGSKEAMVMPTACPNCGAKAEWEDKP